MKPANLLFIMSDQHARDITGCYGNDVVKTPNMDALAAWGTRFDYAYTNSPICVPARAGLATGRYIHQIRCWDSAQPYYGQFASWGHRLMEAGHRVVSIGKLHYRSSEDKNGFHEEILPIHVHKKIGWAKCLIRKEWREYPEGVEYAHRTGPGESPYTHHDRNVCARACEWIEQEAPRYTDKPWVLYVGFVSPHNPFMAPKPFYNLYSPDEIPPPRQHGLEAPVLHPPVAAIKDFFNYDSHFDEDRVKIAKTGYFGLCSFLDDNIGKIMAAIEKTGLSENTRIVYTSDHGDCLGNRGIWAKSVMYEESVAIPMIMAGPDIPEDKTVSTPVSLVDGYPTIIEGAGERLSQEEQALPGQSLIEIAQGNFRNDKVVFSEYHDGGSITGTFMIRTGRWKYVYHVGYSPQLFDLDSDPLERTDLGMDPAYGEVLSGCDAKLREIVDPEIANEMAFNDQRQKIEELGGIEAIKSYEVFDFTPVPE
jgi:choline-sulfatase